MYRNASPDTLGATHHQLMMNVHQPGAPRFGGVSEDFFTTGVHVDTLRGERQRSWSGRRTAVAFTWKPAPLPDGARPGRLACGCASTGTTTWPSRPSREGVIDSTTYYIAYFYPRVAVYDDYQGWDRMEHTPSHEFY